MRLKTDGRWFVDDLGRKVLLRGVNLGGSTKIPTTPDGATHLSSEFIHHRDVSFVDRPFPLEEAEEHFSRLANWGFNTIRLLTSWEAIEHSGPKQYDHEYLDYFKNVVEIAGDYGFYVFIDPHQDVWSRMTGGDGAPGWTFEKVGLDLSTFADTGSAKIMQAHYPHKYLEMEWFMNYQRFAVATMFTLFFGSEDFAPEAKINGQSIQHYLQDHYTQAMVKIAEKIKDYDHVIGFDSMNEPHPGFIGIPDITQFPARTPPGLHFTPIDAIAAGGGNPRPAIWYSQELVWIKRKHVEVLNPRGISNWIDPDADIWKNHEVYEYTNDTLTTDHPDYFYQRPDGSPVNYFRDYLRPFAMKYINALRGTIPDAILFVEGHPEDPVLDWHRSDSQGVVNASHWYDSYTMFSKSYRSWFTIDVDREKPVFLPRNVNRYHLRQLLKRGKESDKIGIPTLIGEFGIPFDMNNKKSYRTGNFKDQINSLNHYYNYLDALQFHSTQWNYTSDNSNQWGDLWNMEDLSIFSRDQQLANWKDNLNSGSRALKGFCRPHPVAVSGNPVKWFYKFKSTVFHFNYENLPGETVVFLPDIVYPNPEIRLNTDIPFQFEDQYLYLDSRKVPEDFEITLRVKNRD